MNRVQVVIDGTVIGERKTGRPYSHAVVAEQHSVRVPHDQQDRSTWWKFTPLAEPKLAVLSYHHSATLAQQGVQKALDSIATAGSFDQAVYRRPRVVATTTVAMARRERVRCTGLRLQRYTTDGLPWARAMQCLKDATTTLNGEPRCALHAQQDNEQVRVAAGRTQAEHNVALQQRWEAWHRDHVPAHECKAGEYGRTCSVHGEAK
jgi:hypothetical protein